MIPKGIAWADEITGGADPGLRLDLAEALVLTEDPAVQGKAREIIDGALAADELNQKALWYSGVLAVRANDNETAKARWTKLLEQNPPPEIRQIIVSQLEAIGAEVPAMAAAASPPAMGGGMAGMGGKAPAGEDEAVGRTIRVALSVDPAIAGKLKPGTPLFVSARQPGIPGPPLAAVRISSDQLPTTVVLSDANSMMRAATFRPSTKCSSLRASPSEAPPWFPAATSSARPATGKARRPT